MLSDDDVATCDVRLAGWRIQTWCLLGMVTAVIFLGLVASYFGVVAPVLRRLREQLQSQRRPYMSVNSTEAPAPSASGESTPPPPGVPLYTSLGGRSVSQTGSAEPGQLAGFHSLPARVGSTADHSAGSNQRFTEYGLYSRHGADSIMALPTDARAGDDAAPDVGLDLISERVLVRSRAFTLLLVLLLCTSVSTIILDNSCQVCTIDAVLVAASYLLCVLLLLRKSSCANVRFVRLWLLVRAVLEGVPLLVDADFGAYDVRDWVRVLQVGVMAGACLGSLFLQLVVPPAGEGAEEPLLYCPADKPAVAAEGDGDVAPSPMELASTGSKLFLLWLREMMATGLARPLQKEDLVPPPVVNDCDANTELLLKQLGAGRRLVPALRRLYGRKFAHNGLWLLTAALLGFSGPLILDELVLIAERDEPDYELAVPLVVVLFLCKVAQAVAQAQYDFRAFTLGIRAVTAVKGVLYQKLITIDAAAADAAGGDLINLFTTDSDRVFMAAPGLHYLWTLPLQIVGAMTLLYLTLGVAMFAGFGVIVVTLALNNVVARRMRGASEQGMRCKDARLSLSAEVFAHMGFVKLNAWEHVVRARLMAARHAEMRQVWRVLFLGGINVFLLWLAPLVVSLATFAVYTKLMGEVLTANKVFTSLALFKLLQEPLRSLPNYITQIIQANVSLRRFDAFLAAPELDPQAVSPTAAAVGQIVVDDATWAWGNAPDVLRNVTLGVEPGQLVLVVGRVAAGKSSLLAGLLGELQVRRGFVAVGGRVAYCSQQPWVQNLSLRDNILFGRPFDEAWYQRVVRACGLLPDLANFPDGDQTLAGDRGLNLSGGQRMRVALARACYADADVYVLDSPLAAMDALVGESLFENCVLQLLGDKTRVMVTHQPNLVTDPRVSAVLRVDGEQGRVELVDVDASSRAGAQRARSISREAGLFPLDAEEAPARPIESEQRSVGRVGADVYGRYLTAVGGRPIVLAVLLVMTLWQTATISSDWWLNNWSEEDDAEQSRDLDRNLEVYAVLVAVAGSMTLARTMSTATFGFHASRLMYERMVDALLAAPMRFYDASPVGRLLNRMSDDQAKCDNDLPFAFGSTCAWIFSLAGTLLITAYYTRYVGIFILPLGWLYRRLAFYYLSSSREVQRLQQISLSPLINALASSVDGVSTLRAFGFDTQRRFVHTTQRLVDANNRCNFANIAANAWFAVRVECLGAVLLLVIAGTVMFFGSDFMDPGLVGLVITYALSMSDGLVGLVKIWAKLENQMVSVERLAQFADVPPERLEGAEPAADWPQRGRVEFQDVVFKYTPDGDPVLRGLTFAAEPGQSVGIVGRTGAGKSSVANALFRIADVAGGRLRIDGVDVAAVPARRLRARLGIISQEPVLFSGSLRDFLDPEARHSDGQVWAAVEQVGMAEDARLGMAISENGCNFSLGQRQMLCLARAVLAQPRVVVLDEATAAVDAATDAKLQQVVRSAFAGATVLAIAHRINTILDSDRILVLDAGVAAEFGPPGELLEDRNSAFRRLAQAQGLLGVGSDSE